MMRRFFLELRTASGRRLLALWLMLCCTLYVMGQGVSDVKITHVDTQPQKTCRADGQITIQYNNPLSRNIVFQLLDGAGRVLVSNSTSPFFSQLAAGDYEVRLVNANNHNEIFVKQKVMVKNQYVRLDRSSVKVSIEGLCTSYKPGGTIKIDANSIKGGTKPFQYSVIEHNDAGYLDNLSKYSTGTEIGVTKWGRYQVRIKDACGDYVTITQDVQPVLKAVQVRSYPINNQPCGSNKGELFNIGLYDVNTGGRIDFASYANYGGVKLEIRDKNATGKVLYNKTIKHGNHSEIHGNQDFVFDLSPTHEYWAKATTPCGDVWEGKFQNDTRIRFSPRAASVGCPGGNEGMKIMNSYYIFGRYPATVRFVNISKHPEKEEQSIRILSRADQRFESKVLPYGDYRVEIIPDCGKQYGPKPVMVYNVKDDGTFRMGDIAYDLDMCDGNGLYTEETGTTGVTVSFRGFYYDQNNAVARIISGPSNVGVKGFPWDFRYRWYNMKPGHYKAEITSCGYKYYAEFDVDPPNHKILQQEIKSKADSKCSGGGSITSTIKYNGSFSYLVELLDEDGMPVKDAKGEPMTSTNGSFSNLPPGTYVTRIQVAPWCDKNDKYYYVYSQQPMVITDAAAGSQIKNFLGVTCEDLHGTPGMKGTIYLLLSAAENPKLEYRKKGTTVWQTIPYESNVKIEGLDNIATYEVKLSSCGQSVQREVTVKPITPILRSHVKHPCLEHAYRLSLPYYSGATYAWSKNGALLSNGTAVDFPKFKASDNGVYICKVQWGNCVTREVQYTLNANLCGEDVGEVSLEGTVFNDQNGLSNGSIDGTPIYEADGKQLYIHVLMLKNGSYQHVGTRTPVGINGKFAIPGLSANSKYRLILTTSEVPVTSSTPIQRWNFVGEYYQNTGSDGTPDGVLELNVGTGSMLDLRFGLRRAGALRTNRHITTKL